MKKCWYEQVCSEFKPDCYNSCIRYMEMQNLVESSQIPKNKQYPDTLEAGVDYDSFVELANIKSNIKQVVEDGENLYLHSKTTGNGKTSWSIKIMLKYFDEIWAGNGFRTRALFVHTPTLLIKLKDFNNPLPQEYIDNLMNCDLVVWDDIGASGLSNYDLTQLLLFIDNRINNGLSNIYTGNLDKVGLEVVIGQRLASRVWNSTYNIELVGRDRR